MTKKLSLLRLLTLVLSACISVAQTEHKNVFTGTWKYNMAKSKPGPGDHQSRSMTFAPDGRFTFEFVEQGKAYKASHRWSGGSEVPVEGWIENASVIGTVRDHVYEETLKMNGKIMDKARFVVSRDGKTMTVTINRTDDHGRPVQSMEVYDKQ